jgi:hypothetical protein
MVSMVQDLDTPTQPESPMSEKTTNGNGAAADRHVMSIRFSPETKHMLDALAVEARRKTGFRVSYSALFESLVQTEYAKLSAPKKKALKAFLK